MNNKDKTIETYQKSAKELAKKFDSQGARIYDIKEVFDLVNKDNPVVLEIGCGNGRDAFEILRYTNNYLGVDISQELIKLAMEKNPGAKFKLADIEDYAFLENLDIIFAFASLIHVPKENLKSILDKSFNALNKGGVVRISLKYSDMYKEVTKEDEFGVRTYYLYSRDDIKNMSDRFEILRSDINHLRNQDWLEVVLKKN